MIDASGAAPHLLMPGYSGCLSAQTYTTRPLHFHLVDYSVVQCMHSSLDDYNYRLRVPLCCACPFVLWRGAMTWRPKWPHAPLGSYLQLPRDVQCHHCNGRRDWGPYRQQRRQRLALCLLLHFIAVCAGILQHLWPAKDALLRDAGVRSWFARRCSAHPRPLPTAIQHTHAYSAL